MRSLFSMTTYLVLWAGCVFSHQSGCAVGQETTTAVSADVNAILASAIDALGGEAVLKEVKGLAWSATGAIGVGQQASPTAEIKWAFADSKFESEFFGPEQYKFDLDVSISGSKFVMKTIVNSDSAWQSGNGEKRTVRGAAAQKLRRLGEWEAVIRLVTPLRDAKLFTVKAVGPSTIDGREVETLRVTRKSGESIMIHFDAKTKLPWRLEGKTSLLEGTEPFEVLTVDDYKKVDRLLVAMSSVTERDGKVAMKQSLTKVTLLKEVDKDRYAIPVEKK